MLLLLACDDGYKGETRGGDTDTSGPTENGGENGGDTTDADADGSLAAEDCDDHDPAVHPGAPEDCDGVDDDCDGVVDDGVPSDGAGCRDPGWPADDGVVQSVEITLRTGSASTDGTDDPIVACLGDDCWNLDVADWNDREPGTLEVHHFDGLALDASTWDTFTIYTTTGDDQWQPAGFQASADGRVVYCRTVSTLEIGNTGDETLSYSDPLGTTCDTVYDAILTHGPMTGYLGADGVRLWYRTDATRRALLRVAPTAEALADAAPVHYGYPSPSTDFTQEVVVHGLTAGTTWAWDLEIDGVRFGPWSFTVAPSPGTKGVHRIAFGSCTKTDEQPGFAGVLAWAPELYVFAGDNHYGNTPNLGAHRQQYRWAHSRAWRSELLHRASILATWDDHDYVGNNKDGTAAGGDVAARAFHEFWGNAPVEGGYIYSTASWGDVDLFLVDDRTWRGLDDSIVGNEQEAWLYAAVRASTATFKLVVSGSQWTPSGSDDSWAAFDEARVRTLQALTEVPGVVLLSGDVHKSEFHLLTEGRYPVPELTSSSLAYDPPSPCSDEPDLLTCYDADQSWVSLEVDTTAGVLLATIRDELGREVTAWEIFAADLVP